MILPDRLVRCVYIAVALSLGTAWAGGVANAEHSDHTVATAWFDLYVTLVSQTPGFTAPVAARAYGYAGVTLYESLVFAMPEHRSLAGSLDGLEALPSHAGPEPLDAPTVANAALAHATRALFPTARDKNVVLIDELERRIEHAQAERVDDATLERSRAHGRAVASAIVAWSLDDGGADAYARNIDPDYVVPAGATWEPTPRQVGAPLPPLLPQWGDNRPFVPGVVSACTPPPPPAYSYDPASLLYQEALEVVEAVRSITPLERETAQFWADDAGSSATPAGHWFAILTNVLESHDATLSVAAEGYARLGIALNDAFISCWSTKFDHLYVRPITYIRRAIDPDWNLPRLTDPLLTPPFPEYTSGHSVVSGAAAGVLTALFGDDVAFVDDFHVGRGFDPRGYDSFWQAADEAAFSRLVGGIHFRSGIEYGVLEGRCVAERVMALPLRGAHLD